jgi:hypothetical protein
LGALSRRLADPVRMYREVTDLLSLQYPDLTHHNSLLRLSRTRDNRIVLVTTNFDTLFERAVEDVEGNTGMADAAFNSPSRINSEARARCVVPFP